MAQALKMEQRQRMRLTQQQIRLVQLLEKNSQELDDEVAKELVSNPALEVAEYSPEREQPATSLTDSYTPLYLRRARNASPGDEHYEYIAPDESATLYDVLSAQVAERELPPMVTNMAKYIIGNLDPNGWLRRPLQSMINDLAFSGIEVNPEDAEAAYGIVRDLDPAGVGAENLQDCILLQLHRLPDSERRTDAINIITHQYDALIKHHSKKILSALHLSRERMDAAIELIRRMNGKPGASIGGGREPGSIVPDFIVNRESGVLYVSLNNRIPDLAIAESYAEAVRGVERRRGRPRKKGYDDLSVKYVNEASDFIEVLRQRQEKMLTVMTAIMNKQQDYFETEDVYLLKPMVLEDLSAFTGLDTSVISRATSNKFVQMPSGEIHPLRFFFSDVITTRSSAAPQTSTTATAGSDAAAANAEDEVGSQNLGNNGGDNGGDNKGTSGVDTDNSAEEEEALTNRKVEALIRKLVNEEDKLHPLSDDKLRIKMKELGYDISRRTIAKYRDRIGIQIARLRKEI